MARPGLFTLMARNWKKSIFYVTASNTALWFTYDYTVTRDVMKNSCKKASAYGDERIRNPTGTPIRHITVILNPVAGKRKSKKLYEKWVEPLMHLAGIKVSLIETESINQAYDLMKIMSNCDGVAIVGGDGTVHEALNGLLSRPDCIETARDIPIGIIPTGQFNSIARYVHQNHLVYRNQKEFLIRATMTLVDSCQQKFDVLKIDPLMEKRDQTNEEKTEGVMVEQPQTTNTPAAPIYALRDIRYGIYQDNFYKITGYKIYQTYIKPIWLRVRRTFSYTKYPPPKIKSISYTAPCAGCSACYDKHRLQDSQQVKADESSASRRWWTWVVPVSRVNSSESSDEKKKLLEMSQRENPDCQRRVRIGDVESITDFRACMMGDKKVRLSLGRHREYAPSDITETKDIRLEVAEEIDEAMVQSSQQKDDKPQEGEADNGEVKAEPAKDDTKDEKKTEQFLIDGQPTQAHSLEIRAIDEAVTIFTGRKIIPTYNKRVKVK